MGGANLLAMLSSAGIKPAAPKGVRASSGSKGVAAVADRSSEGNSAERTQSAVANSKHHKKGTLHSLRMQVYGSCGGVAAAPPVGAAKQSFKPMGADELRRIGEDHLAQAAAGKPENGACDSGRRAGAPGAGPWDWPRKYLMWPQFLPIFAVQHSGPVLTANSRAGRRRVPKAVRGESAASVPAPAARGGRGGKNAPPTDGGTGDWRSASKSTRIDYERTDDIENEQVGELATLPAFFQPVDDDDDDGGLGGLEEEDGALEGGSMSPEPHATQQAPLSAAAKKSERMRARVETERLQQRRQWAEEEEERRLATETRNREIRAAGGTPTVPEHSPGLLGSKPPSPRHEGHAAHAGFGGQGGSLLSQRISRAFGEGTPPPQSPQQTPVSPAQTPAAAEAHSASSRLLARAKMAQSPAGKQSAAAGSAALHSLFASAKVVPASSSAGSTALQMLQQSQQRGGSAVTAPGSSAVPLQYRGGLYTHAAVEQGAAHTQQHGQMPQGHGMGQAGIPHGMMQGRPGMHPGYMQGGYMGGGYAQAPPAFQGQQVHQRGQYMQAMPGQVAPPSAGVTPGQPTSQAAYMHAMSMQHAQMAYSGGMHTHHIPHGASQFAPQHAAGAATSGAPWAAPPQASKPTPQSSMQAQIQQQTAAVQGTAQRQQAAATARAAAGQLLLDKAATLQAATSQPAKAGNGKNKKRIPATQNAGVHRMVPTTVIKRR